MKWNKITGYPLVSVGLGMIIISVYLMYAVFTNSIEPPKILRLNDIELLIPLPVGGVSVKTTLIQGDQFSKLVNMLLWAVFMLFIVSAGGKICDIGVKLIKEVKG